MSNDEKERINLTNTAAEPGNTGEVSHDVKEASEKPKEKKKLWPQIIAIAICVLLVVAMVVIYFTLLNKQYSISDTVSVRTYQDEEYYIIEGDYAGEYDLQFLEFEFDSELGEEAIENFDEEEVMNYAEYKAFCEKWGIRKRYVDSSKEYIVFSYLSLGASDLEARLADVKYDGDEVNLYIWDDESGYDSITAYAIIIPTEEEVEDVKITSLYTEAEFEIIEKYGEDTAVDKPIIYLYPTEEMKVTVKLMRAENITVSYPSYGEGWSVLAEPSGELTDLATGRELYALYYESKNEIEFKVEEEGFCVKGEDSAEFLEEKLAKLGLTEREAEEFIVYWLPKLEENKYNYIRFATMDEINENMPLDFSEEPDSLVRILMAYKGLDEAIEVKEQELETPERSGFVVVEWGGTEIE